MKSILRTIRIPIELDARIGELADREAIKAADKQGKRSAVIVACLRDALKIPAGK